MGNKKVTAGCKAVLAAAEAVLVEREFVEWKATARRRVILRVINSCSWRATHSVPYRHTHTHAPG